MHRDFESSAELLKESIFKHLDALSLIKEDTFFERRISRYDNYVILKSRVDKTLSLCKKHIIKMLINGHCLLFKIF